MEDAPNTPSFICSRCSKPFVDNAHLTRHRARRAPCRPADAMHRCECGRAYSHRSSLYRHKATCLAAKKNAGRVRDSKGAHAASKAQIDQAAHVVQNIQNIQTTITIAPVTTNILALGDLTVSTGQGAGGGAEPRLPGWPAKWPPVAAPRSFSVSNITIPFDILQRALAAGTERAEACRRGESAAIAALLVEIVRLVHADPRERNMYPNPNRADQVLVYIPERWETLPLQEGIRLALTRAADGLTETLPFMALPLQSLAQAAQAGFRAKQSEVMKSSRGAMAAHLENMAVLARCGNAGDCWLGDLADLQEIEQPRVFGEERYNHVSVAALVASLEVALGVYGATDLAAANLPVLARRALATFGRQLLIGHPENLTIILAKDGMAHVHTPRGWRPAPVAEAARQQARAFSLLVARYLEMPDALHLAPLGHYIARDLKALAGEESKDPSLLMQYARAAEKYYSATDGRALEVPRALLLERTQGLAPRLPEPGASGMEGGQAALVVSWARPRDDGLRVLEQASPRPAKGVQAIARAPALAKLSDEDVDALLADYLE